jgi:hypothetical protein
LDNEAGYRPRLVLHAPARLTSAPHAERRGLAPFECLAPRIMVLPGDPAARGAGLDRLVEHPPALRQQLAIGRRSHSLKSSRFRDSSS